MEKKSKKQGFSTELIPAALVAGELPEILKEGKTFRLLKNKWTRPLFNMMDEMLKPEVADDRTYFNWFSQPEKWLNQSLIEKKENPELWLKRVSIMLFALTETLSLAMERELEKRRKVEQNMRMIDDRINTVNSAIESYQQLFSKPE